MFFGRTVLVRKQGFLAVSIAREKVNLFTRIKVDIVSGKFDRITLFHNVVSMHPVYCVLIIKLTGKACSFLFKLDLRKRVNIHGPNSMSGACSRICNLIVFGRRT